jgi:hypothetical protein
MTHTLESKHIWNFDVRSLYMTGSLKTNAKDLAKYRLNLLAVDVRLSKGGNELVYIIINHPTSILLLSALLSAKSSQSHNSSHHVIGF